MTPAPTAPSLDTDFLLRLLRDRKERERSQRFVIEGSRFLHCALAHGFPILGIVHARELLLEPSAQRLVRVLRRQGVPDRRVSADELRKLSILDEPQGIAALVASRWASVHAPFLPTKSLWLGVDEIRSPGNLGTMLRTACAAGATGVAFTSDAADPWDPRCVRATMGALFALRLARTTPRDVDAWRRRTGGRVVGADGTTPLDYRRASYRGPTLIMLGCERRGLSGRQRALCDDLVSIPMHGGIDSLNVAAAAAVLLYEAHRQRQPA